MTPEEIRAIRGALSRAAFARLLGVTPLTVLRWELPTESDEARRPRAKMIEALRKLAGQGVGNNVAGADLVSGDDDDEPDVSETVATKAVSSNPLASFAPASEEETVLRVTLQRLWQADWSAAADTLLDLLVNGKLTTPATRALASLGVAQAQLLGHYDIRGTLTTLMPVLEQVQRGTLPQDVAARAHVLAAALFGAPDIRVHDSGRVNVHGALADSLLGPDDDDLRVFIVAARMSSARLASASVVRIHGAAAASIERASSPLALVLVSQVRAVLAQARGDATGAARHGQEMLERAEQLSLRPLVIAMLGLQVGQMLHQPITPAQVLGLTALCRARSKDLIPAETSVRILAAEIEGLVRLGRLADAEAVYRELLQLGKSAGLPLFAASAPVARLFLLLQRPEELEQLADVIAGQTPGTSGRRLPADVHALLLRAVVALARSEPQLALDRCQGVLEELELRGEAGTEYLVRDAHWVALRARAALKDWPQLDVARRSFEKVLEQQPSHWYSARLSQLNGSILLERQHFAEARGELQAALASFERLGDMVQFAQIRQELERLERLAPYVAPRSGTALSERLADAVERLSRRAPTLELFEESLLSSLHALFPGREARGEILDGCLHLEVGGALDGEQQAVLRTLRAVAALGWDLLPQAAAAVPDDADVELPGFLAVSDKMRQLKRELAQLARSNATILVTGESGSGKEVVARAVHDLSSRSQHPYVTFNCASVPRELFESQLFGHKKGAFTGATADNPGVIRAAQGGTLFLDEVAELPLDTQPKLLRFLENAEVLPIGEQTPRRVNVRIVAATHRDLGRLVREGAFREDLYYRLNVVPLHIPPLRERKDDVVALARMFLRRLATDTEEPPLLATDAVRVLQQHSWPGNVRELRNVLERAMAYHPVPRVLGVDQLRLV